MFATIAAIGFVYVVAMVQFSGLGNEQLAR